MLYLRLTCNSLKDKYMRYYGALGLAIGLLGSVSLANCAWEASTALSNPALSDLEKITSFMTMLGSVIGFIGLNAMAVRNFLGSYTQSVEENNNHAQNSHALQSSLSEDNNTVGMRPLRY
jgi:hypothetical protein